MAAETQFEDFKTAYLEENERYAELESRANMLLGVITLYLGAFAFRISEATEFLKQVSLPVWTCLMLGVPLLGALLCTLTAMVIPDYERPFDPEKLIGRMAKARSPVSDDEFLDERISACRPPTSSARSPRAAPALLPARWRGRAATRRRQRTTEGAT